MISEVVIRLLLVWLLCVSAKARGLRGLNDSLSFSNEPIEVIGASVVCLSIAAVLCLFSFHIPIQFFQVNNYFAFLSLFFASVQGCYF